MGSSVESGLVLFLSLGVKCGGLAANSSRLLSLATAVLLFCLATAFLHWTSPGGPAWGRYWWSRKSLRTAETTIPGPRGFLFVGSMGIMAGLAHRKLAAAAEALDARRLMALSLGHTKVVITSNPDVAREILSSSAFADRPIKESAYGLMFHRAIGFAPYGAYWRMLRRIAATHLFSPKQITASALLRAQIAAEMLAAFRSVEAQKAVQLRRIIRPASLSNVMRSVFGKKYTLEFGWESEEMKELRCLVEEGYDLLGTLNWSDHLPMLAGLDLQKIRSRCSRLVPRISRFVNRTIDEHRSGIGNESETTLDFVDILLSSQGNGRLSDPDMVAVLLEMIFRGTDTVAVLMEWVLARLVLHPDVQRRVQKELDEVVGRNREVTESDTGSLVYLQAVLKETLRMHPPGPLLSWARLATSDVVVDGLLVPAGTTAMVNMWAITHDPTVWADPMEFRPDRFLGPNGAEFPVLGSDLRLAPFGSGRRSCPGKALAMATVSFWVATLMHEFEMSEPPDQTRVELSEILRLSCEMAVPLTVKLQPRRRMG